MIRIAGVNIPDEKCIDISLTYIYGIGLSTSRKILADLKIDPAVRAKDITQKDSNKLRDIIESDYSVEGELRHERKMNVRRLKEVGCYRGSRHQKGLPVRGQRTKTNNRTVRGNKRMTAGSGRSAAASKT
ncbi:MAG: 30S ribosomal protein S13 [Patescibacteria group bacterium]|nr:30S ribosomal protein S13 [Patescibacteria group bacterium]